MPLHWNIQSRLKLVTAVAEGDVLRQDVDAYLAMVVGAKVSPWRKLIDARTARLVLSVDEVNEIGVRIRAADATHVVGPLAVVMPTVETPELLRLLGFLAAAKRPMRVFHKMAPARKWIMAVDPSRELAPSEGDGPATGS